MEMEQLLGMYSEMQQMSLAFKEFAQYAPNYVVILLIAYIAVALNVCVLDIGLWECGSKVSSRLIVWFILLLALVDISVTAFQTFDISFPGSSTIVFLLSLALIAGSVAREFAFASVDGFSPYAIVSFYLLLSVFPDTLIDFIFYTAGYLIIFFVVIAVTAKLSFFIKIPAAIITIGSGYLGVFYVPQLAPFDAVYYVLIPFAILQTLDALPRFVGLLKQER